MKFSSVCVLLRKFSASAHTRVSKEAVGLEGLRARICLGDVILIQSHVGFLVTCTTIIYRVLLLSFYYG